MLQLLPTFQAPVVPATRLAAVSLLAGQTTPHVDAGLFQLGNVSGLVWDDSDANPFSGRTAAFALTPTQTAPVLDAGLHQPGSFSGVVWEDSDGDGVRKSGEPLRAFFTVSLLDAGGNFLAGTNTATDGSYQFGNLAPGSYTFALWCGPVSR